ncbi:MAG: ParB/RepB/Spo0J family partition protein [Bifidobacteriaceae bacterium]|jgi:ParB family chromosome partitioning protein|nr:ParB/RepB/Spo0J family partition protein [Bifidobacteriaceae bacterium]
MSEKRRGLGRGLGALIPPVTQTGQGASNPASRPVDVFFGQTGSPSTPDLPDDAASPASTAGLGETEVAVNDVAAEGLVAVPGASFAELPLDSIRPNPRQPRQEFDQEALDELTASVKEVGLLQPIVVRPLDEDPDGAKFEIVMGERRWRAVVAAGLEAIPAIVRQTADEDLLRDALLENLHRSQLNPLEEAAAYRQLLDDFGCTHEELSQKIARSRPQVTNTLRLLKLPPPVQRRLAAGVLSAGHARALLSLEDPGAAERLATRIIAEGLSVRSTEELVALGETPKGQVRRRAPRPGTRTDAVDALQDRLSDRFDTRVKVSLGAKKGRLTVEFASVKDLNRILELLAPGDPGLFS